MQVILSLVLFILISFSSIGQNTEEIDLNKILPSELIAVSDSVYAEKYEVSNAEYMFFRQCIEKEGKKELLEFIQPYNDHINWETLISNSLFLEKKSRRLGEGFLSFQVLNNLIYYQDSYFFADFPIVGITHDQAKLYCQWKSGYVSRLINEKLEGMGYSIRLKLTYRLPVKAEWLKVYGDSKSYNHLIDYSNNARKGLRELGFKKVSGQYYDLAMDQPFPFKNDSLNLFEIGVNFPGSVDSHSPNPAGLFNMKGNVAEMINEEGIALGGSWKDRLSEIDSEPLSHYSCPAEWLGFRLFCDVEIVEDTTSAFIDYEERKNSSCFYVRERNNRNNVDYYLSMIDSLLQNPVPDIVASRFDDQNLSLSKDSIKLKFDTIKDSIVITFVYYGGNYKLRPFQVIESRGLDQVSLKMPADRVLGLFIETLAGEERKYYYTVVDNDQEDN